MKKSNEIDIGMLKEITMLSHINVIWRVFFLIAKQPSINLAINLKISCLNIVSYTPRSKMHPARTAQVRAVIIAKGDVQRVGYRDVVERIAHKMRLTGFVENVKPYDVRIVCEGDQARVERFIEQINIREFPIDVEDLDVKFEDATEEFGYFEIRRGDWTEELGERLDSARAELKQNTLNLKEFRKETNEVLKGFREDTNDNFKLLHSDMTKHDVAAQNRIEGLNKEIIELRERITRVESLVADQQ